ncbi:MAG TPA: MnhB domain-containing protein [Acidimicrobiales bacterium]|nr:MnhB domain-containing protein [Acidimicrobiales bacterium]
MRGGDRSLVLSVGVRLLVPTVLLFSVYLLFAGHNHPGGGFVGGLTASAAFVLRSVEAGEPAALARGVAPFRLLGAGLLLTCVTAVTPWLFGDQLLETAKLERDVPVLGVVKTTTSLPFDIGVYLVVVALVLVVLGSLGDEEEHA